MGDKKGITGTWTILRNKLRLPAVPQFHQGELIFSSRFGTEISQETIRKNLFLFPFLIALWGSLGGSLCIHCEVFVSLVSKNKKLMPVEERH